MMQIHTESMQFSFEKSLEILERTPDTVYALLHDLSDEWIHSHEGDNTWTAKEVVAHLLVCEETSWLPRARIILSDDPTKVFAPVDMMIHFERAQQTSLEDLLIELRYLRKAGIEELRAYNLQQRDFSKTALHPVLGEVKLQELISTWSAHDLTHLAQIARILARQHKNLVGGFRHYLRILE